VVAVLPYSAANRSSGEALVADSERRCAIEHADAERIRRAGWLSVRLPVGAQDR